MVGGGTYIRQLLSGAGVWSAEDEVDCNLNVNVTITIDARTYLFPVAALLREVEVGQCYVGLERYDATPERLVIGGFFLTHYCQSLDIGNNRIGFSKSLLVKRA